MGRVKDIYYTGTKNNAKNTHTEKYDHVFHFLMQKVLLRSSETTVKTKAAMCPPLLYFIELFDKVDLANILSYVLTYGQ